MPRRKSIFQIQNQRDRLRNEIRSRLASPDVATRERNMARLDRVERTSMRYMRNALNGLAWTRYNNPQNPVAIASRLRVAGIPVRQSTYMGLNNG